MSIEFVTCLSSNRRDNLLRFFDSFTSTTCNTILHKIIVKIDRCDDDMLKIYADNTNNNLIDFIITDAPAFGSFGGLELAQNQYIIKASIYNPYFFLFANDEIRFKMKNWDLEILKYKHRFVDDIFKIRTATYKNEKYNYSLNDIFAMLSKPDSHSFYTMKLLYLLEGQGDFFWAYDSYFEPIMQFLRLKYGYDRDLIFEKDIFEPESLLSGQGAGEQSFLRMKRANAAFDRLQREEYINYTYDRIAKNIAEWIKHG